MDFGTSFLMDILGFIGVASLVLTYLHFFRPETVSKIDDVGKKEVIKMSGIAKSRRGAIWLGVFYFIAGLCLVYVGFLWSR